MTKEQADKIAEVLVFMEHWYESTGIEPPINLVAGTIRLFTEENANVTFHNKDMTIRKHPK